MRYLYFSILLSFFLSGCDSLNNSDPEPDKIVSFTGKANKGPFQTGSEVTIVELDGKLTPTGKTYFSEILDNDGSFELSGIKLKSNFIEVRVNGFFYDECMRQVTDNKLSLTSVAEIHDGAVSNVNILTHLERKRVAGLLDMGMSFENAKSQSFEEMMAVFGFDVNKKQDAGNMLLLNASNDAEILFAASSIISACVPWKTSNDFAAWNSFLVNFANDFGDNGKIDNEIISTQLYSAAYYVKENVERIRKGIDNAFSNQFFSYDIPDFEKYINQSLENSPYKGAYDDLVNRLIPERVDGSLNILRLPYRTVLNPDSSYVIHVGSQPSAAEYSISIDMQAEMDFGNIEISSEDWTSFKETINEYHHSVTGRILFTNETTRDVHIPVSNISGTGDISFYFNIFTGDVSPDQNLDINASW